MIQKFTTFLPSIFPFPKARVKAAADERFAVGAA